MFCVSFLLAVAVTNYVHIPTEFIFIVCVVAGVGYFLSRSAVWLSVMLVMFGLWLGIERATSIDIIDYLAPIVGDEVLISGTVSSTPHIAPSFTSFRLQVVNIAGEDVPSSEDIFVLLSSDNSVVKHNDKLVLSCKIEPSKYDDGYICAFPEVVEYYRYSATGLNKILGIAHQKFVEALSGVYIQPVAGFMVGILVGGTAQFSDDLVEQFRVTGTLHLVALSGFNISIIVGFVMLIYERVGIPRRWYSASIASLLVVFVLFVGAQASIVRAAIMGFLVVLARQRGRYTTARNLLTATAMLMVLISPEILLGDIGFQLSFLATVGIIYFSPLLEKWTQRLPDMFQFKEALLLAVSAELMVLPVLVWYFGHLSVVSPITNMLVGPLIPIAMLFGFLGGVVGLINITLGQMVGLLGWLVGGLILKIIEIFAQLPYAYVPVSWPILLVVGYYIFLFVMYRYAVISVTKYVRQPWRAR